MLYPKGSQLAQSGLKIYLLVTLLLERGSGRVVRVLSCVAEGCRFESPIRKTLTVHLALNEYLINFREG